MSKGRLEAFSDGVIAIIITIMVLELRPPEETTLAALLKLTPVFLSYVVSFFFIGIYWNNHHHLLQSASKVDGRVLWANLHLLFWLSLVPFATAWMGENNFASLPVALYGLVLFFAGFAYYLLSRALIAVHGRDSLLARAIGSDWKGKVSVVICLLAVPLAFVNQWLSCGLYIALIALWFIPDQRLEKNFMQQE